MLRKAKDLSGYKLAASDGEIGKVQEFYFDDQKAPEVTTLISAARTEAAVSSANVRARTFFIAILFIIAKPSRAGGATTREARAGRRSL